MRVSVASLSFLTIATALASGCQAPPPPVAAPAMLNPTVACERGCSVGYDSCMDAAPAPVAGVKSGGHSDPVAAAPAPDPGDICRDQLKACLRQCLK